MPGTVISLFVPVYSTVFKNPMPLTKKSLTIGFTILILFGHVMNVNGQEKNYRDIFRFSRGIPSPEIKQPKLHSQVRDVSEDCSIYTYSGLAFQNVKIIVVRDSTFAIANDSLYKDLPIRDLRKLIFIKHGFWKGFLWGSLGTLGLAGIAIAGVVASEPHGEEGFAIPALFYLGLVLALPVGVLSGLITDFFTNDEKFYFDRNYSPSTSNRLKYLVHMHKD
jgi:hypothetical protein